MDNSVPITNGMNLSKCPVGYISLTDDMFKDIANLMDNGMGQIVLSPIAILNEAKTKVVGFGFSYFPDNAKEQSIRK